MKEWEWDLLVIDEGVHEDSLLHNSSELWALADEVSVVIVGDHHPVSLCRKLEDVAIVIARHSLATHQSGWGKHQKPVALKLYQDLLVCGDKSRQYMSQQSNDNS